MNVSVLVSVATIVKQIAHQAPTGRQEIVAGGLLEAREVRAERGNRQQVAADHDVVDPGQDHPGPRLW
jgi:hypothetical protein